MKWIVASANICRTRRTSAIDAQSKCSTPPPRTARMMAGSGLHFTAYITSPGKASTKACVAAMTAAGRRQCIGSSGRSVATRSLTSGSTSEAKSKSAMQRRHGRTGAYSVHRDNPRTAHGRARAHPAAKTNGGQAAQRDGAAGRRTQPVVRVLRIAADRSANIGGSLTTTGPLATGSTEKDALRRCCAPDRRELAARADASSASLARKRCERRDIGAT